MGGISQIEGTNQRARSLLCFWAAGEFRMSHRELTKRLEMSLAGIGFSVERGEVVAR